MRRLIAGAQLMLLLVLTSVVLTGCKDNEEERIRQALTDMGYMDGVSETDITAEAETEEALAAALPEDLTADRSAEAVQSAGEVLPNPAEVLPNPAEILPDPAGI